MFDFRNKALLGASLLSIALPPSPAAAEDDDLLDPFSMDPTVVIFNPLNVYHNLSSDESSLELSGNIASDSERLLTQGWEVYDQISSSKKTVRGDLTQENVETRLLAFERELRALQATPGDTGSYDRFEKQDATAQLEKLSGFVGQLILYRDYPELRREWRREMDKHRSSQSEQQQSAALDAVDVLIARADSAYAEGSLLKLRSSLEAVHGKMLQPGDMGSSHAPVLVGALVSLLAIGGLSLLLRRAPGNERADEEARLRRLRKLRDSYRRD